MSDQPLDGLLVLDMAQFLSGPSAALRLADLGARVIKVERPGGGDICRNLYLTDTDIGGDSTLFHAINRNKESIALDYKQAADRAMLLRLAARADVVGSSCTFAITASRCLRKAARISSPPVAAG